MADITHIEIAAILDGARETVNAARTALQDGIAKLDAAWNSLAQNVSLEQAKAVLAVADNDVLATLQRLREAFPTPEEKAIALAEAEALLAEKAKE